MCILGTPYPGNFLLHTAFRVVSCTSQGDLKGDLKTFASRFVCWLVSTFATLWPLDVLFGVNFCEVGSPLLCVAASDCELRTVICWGFCGFCELQIDKTEQLLC